MSSPMKASKFNKISIIILLFILKKIIKYKSTEKQ